MSDFLASQRQFSVQTDGSIEVVLQSGEKLEFDYSSDVRLKRPDKLRSDRRGEKADAEFYYDGRSFTLYGKNKRYYATADAPGTIDEAIDAAREKLGIEAPAADLLYSNPYKILMEDVVSATDLGKAFVRGVSCRHLAFRGNETDWQIWIEDGPRARAGAIRDHLEEGPGLAEFTVEFSEWNFSPRFGDEVFHFTPRGNDKRINFLDRSESGPGRKETRNETRTPLRHLTGVRARRERGPGGDWQAPDAHELRGGGPPHHASSGRGDGGRRGRRRAVVGSGRGGDGRGRVHAARWLRRGRQRGCRVPEVREHLITGRSYDGPDLVYVPTPM